MDFSDACLTYECGPLEYDDFPKTDDPVYVLGQKYSALYDLDELKKDILSRIWFTYRKNFSPIGGTGPTGDTGWGCMLRCGQMLMVQCLIMRHLGRAWRWNLEKPNELYWRILRMFQDKRTCCYSIHQIASMGVSEGKHVGSWFGPNTVAHVLKKIAVYDEWSSVVMHVAMDNTVIEEDIRTLCTSHANKENAQNSTQHSFVLPVDKKLTTWSPLLLIIPLRLGLTEINALYIDSLKKCLSLKQSVGIIGGKPNHAHWFIGYVGNELVYLDPHTTQQTVDLDCHLASDESYHCQHTSRMKVCLLDPSIALMFKGKYLLKCLEDYGSSSIVEYGALNYRRLVSSNVGFKNSEWFASILTATDRLLPSSHKGFYCDTEKDFDDLCKAFREQIINKTPMFELHELRPHHWPSDYYLSNAAAKSVYTKIGSGDCDTEEEFELLG